ncbi:jeltraxin [Silurus meridionalis]|nr:jeltraxin [Silurus meridionalis]
MKMLVVFISLFLLAAAEKQDLSGKMFTFPLTSNRHYVSLNPELENSNLTAVTVCLRAFSDLPRSQSLFSLELPSTHNAFLIFKPKHGVYKLHVEGQSMEFWGLPDELNAWNSLCATWNGKTGLGQLWVNGKPSVRKGFSRGGFLNGTPKIVLGQQQENYSGGFQGTQSFVGMLTDVHMWDSVLALDQIAKYSYGGEFQPGNVLSWSSLDFSKNGYVITECSKPTVQLKHDN